MGAAWCYSHVVRVVVPAREPVGRSQTIISRMIRRPRLFGVEYPDSRLSSYDRLTCCGGFASSS